MRISILCVEGCQFINLILISTTIEILDIKAREKFKRHRWDFSYLQKKILLFQFHMNLEYYILRSQIRVNFIDFNCFSKEVVLHPPTTSGLKTPLAHCSVCVCWYLCIILSIIVKVRRFSILIKLISQRSYLNKNSFIIFSNLCLPWR